MAKGWLWLILAIISSSVIGHKCVHSRKGPKGPPMRIQETSNLRLLKSDPLDLFTTNIEDSNTEQGQLRKSKLRKEKEESQPEKEDWRPIQIVADFSNFPTDNSVSEDVKDFIKNSVFKTVQKYFADLIKVKGPSTISSFSRTSCDSELKIPSYFSSSDVSADMILFVKIVNEDDDYIAWATTCSLSSTDGRPLTGMIQINQKYLTVSSASIKSFTSSFIHELLHSMAISPYLFDAYPVGKNKAVKTELVDGKKVSKIILPSVIEWAKEHFGCSSADGVFFEDEGDDGSVGSHWEKSQVGNEIMTAQATAFPVLSKLTLSFVNDIGWYKVDFGFAEQLNWGKDKGCEFMKSCLPKFPEFCSTKRMISCTSDFIAKSICSENTFSDNCMIFNYNQQMVCNFEYNSSPSSYPSGFEAIGRFSRCFNVIKDKEKSAVCLASRCSNGLVQFQVLNVQYSCSIAGQVIEIEDIKIICPDPQLFCGLMRKSCPDDCNGRGRCTEEGVCVCDYLWEGESCKTNYECRNGEENVCKLITWMVEDSKGRSYINSTLESRGEENTTDWNTQVFEVNKKKNGSLIFSVPINGISLSSEVSMNWLLSTLIIIAFYSF